jgi:hypothetical protein
MLDLSQVNLRRCHAFCYASDLFPPLFRRKSLIINSMGRAESNRRHVDCRTSERNRVRLDCKTNFRSRSGLLNQLASGMSINLDKIAAEPRRQIQIFQFVIFDLSLVSAGPNMESDFRRLREVIGDPLNPKAPVWPKPSVRKKPPRPKRLV